MVDIQMIYYKSQGTTSDSEVSAMVLLQRRMSLYAGRGFHPDIVLASAYAYLDALNYLLYCEEVIAILSTPTTHVVPILPCPTDQQVSLSQEKRDNRSLPL